MRSGWQGAAVYREIRPGAGFKTGYFVKETLAEGLPWNASQQCVVVLLVIPVGLQKEKGIPGTKVFHGYVDSIGNTKQPRSAWVGYAVEKRGENRG